MTRFTVGARLSEYQAESAEGLLRVAMDHGFASWEFFAGHVQALAQADSAVDQFERAADAVVDGDRAGLEALLKRNRELVFARSTRVHRATLLHYVGANGFENWRQRTPPNAVEMAQILLAAGAEVDAVADAYGESTTLGLVATSVHPVNAGVQIALIETLLAAGASVDGAPGGWNPLIACLHNGRPAAAEFLARCGARMDLEAAAGVGRLGLVSELMDRETPKAPTGFLWACAYGHADVARFLLENGVAAAAQVKGETGLHWAAHGGHREIVEMLLARGAPVNERDRRFEGTPLDWALHGWSNPSPEGRGGEYYHVVERLVAAGGMVDNRGWMAEQVNADERMRKALGW